MVPHAIFSNQQKEMSKNQTPENIKLVFDYWQQEFGYHRRKLNDSRKRCIKARLKSFTVDELKQALDVAKADPFWRGQNERSTPYDDIVNLLRNDVRIEQFLDRGGSRNAPNLFASPNATDQVGF